MAYCAASQVAALCKSVLGGQANFTPSSCPSLQEVNQWMSSGCAIIESTLAGCKYSMPVSANTAAYQWLAQLNALYGAAYTEMSRSNVVLAKDERTRGQVFLEQFWDDLEKLCDGDMTLAGLTRTSSGKLYAGGISRADKQRQEGNTDRVNPRIMRGMFTFPETIDPSSTTAS